MQSGSDARRPGWGGATQAGSDSGRVGGRRPPTGRRFVEGGIEPLYDPQYRNGAFDVRTGPLITTDAPRRDAALFSLSSSSVLWLRSFSTYRKLELRRGLRSVASVGLHAPRLHAPRLHAPRLHAPRLRRRAGCCGATGAPGLPGTREPPPCPVALTLSPAGLSRLLRQESPSPGAFVPGARRCLVLRRPSSPSSHALLSHRARLMLAEPTPTESRLWLEVLSSRRLGVSFRRQVPIAGRYIADFYCASCRLLVEVDGGYHRARSSADARRDRALLRLGYRVLRLDSDLVARDLPRAAALVRLAIAEASG